MPCNLSSTPTDHFSHLLYRLTLFVMLLGHSLHFSPLAALFQPSASTCLPYSTRLGVFRRACAFGMRKAIWGNPISNP